MSDQDDPSLSTQNKTLIIGIGNEYRSDDGVGIVVAGAIEERGLPDVVVKLQSGEGAALMESWKGFSKVIIVDAVRAKLNAGEIYRLDSVETRIPSEFFHYSTHAFSLAESIELARTLGSLPEKLIVFGIQGENFAAGQLLSKNVAEAVNTVKELVFKEVAAIGGATSQLAETSKSSEKP